jgi:hypothetical protein
MPRASSRHVIALQAVIHAIPCVRVLVGTQVMFVASRPRMFLRCECPRTLRRSAIPPGGDRACDEQDKRTLVI